MDRRRKGALGAGTFALAIVFGGSVASAETTVTHLGTVQYQLTEVRPEDNVHVGAGLGLVMPGLLGAEVVADAYDPSFLPGFFLEARGLTSGALEGQDELVLRRATMLSGKIGLSTRSWDYGTGNVELASSYNASSGASRTTFIEDAASPGLSSFGPYAGFELALSDVDEGAATPTALAGLRWYTADWNVYQVGGWGRKVKSLTTIYDLGATYGVSGVRRGLGATFGARQYLWGWVMAGVDTGVIFLNRYDGVSLWETLRLTATVGFRIDFAAHGEKPLNAACVQSTSQVEGCEK